MFVINSPLFAEASRKLKAFAVQQFRHSDFGKAMAQVSQAARKGSPEFVRRQAMAQLQKLSPQNTLRQLARAEFGEVVKQIEKYARSGGLKSEITKFLGDLGPTGKIIQAIIDPGRSSSLQNDLQAAINLIRSFGGEVLMPKTAEPTLGDIARGLQTAQQRLQEYGFSIVGSEGPPRRIVQPEPGRATVDVEMRPIRGKRETSRVSADHPMLTGEMVSAPSSTNVYEFGYDIESLSLYVRFQTAHDEGARGSAGSLYRYSGVTPEEFMSLYRVRNSGGGSGSDRSPGAWVWDHLRERGTVSGHKKDYELVGIMGGYVPRKATLKRTKEIIGKRGGVLKRKGLEEWYEQRAVRTHSGRMVHSVLPTARVSRVIR